MLMYNTDIREGEAYDHDLKYILFKTNCIWIRYTDKDYEKQIVGYVLDLLRAINNPNVDTQDIFQKGLTIDDKIIKDILDVAIYTECFYKMNSVNSARMDECEASKVPFVEQLNSLLLFHQNQTRLVRENYRDFLNPDCITGMELSIANRLVEYDDNLKNSVLDNFEFIIENANGIIHYV